MVNWLKKAFGRKSPRVSVEETSPGEVVVKVDKEDIKVSLSQSDFSNVQFTPRPPIALIHAACPYCGVIQDPPPTRRKKCRDCKETIYTWRH